MNKIHKNLNYANLMKTDWVKQFNPSQIMEIQTGIDNNLDVYLYANPNFKINKMIRIRCDLQLEQQGFKERKQRKN